MNKKDILAYTARLDKLATALENSYEQLGMTREAALTTCRQIDTISDRLEKLIGVNKQAVVIEGDDDEKHYMGQYDKGGVIDGMGDADEKHYMDHYNDDVHDQFEMPIEGESAAELKGKARTASAKPYTDYWGESRQAGATRKATTYTDYWND